MIGRITAAHRRIRQLTGLDDRLGNLVGVFSPEDGLDGRVLFAQVSDLGEVLAHHHDLEPLIDGRVGISTEVLTFDEAAGNAEQGRSGGGRSFQDLVRPFRVCPSLVRGRDLVPNLAAFGAQLGIPLDGIADLLFEERLADLHPFVAQPDQLADYRFVSCQQVLQDRLRDLLVLIALGGEFGDGLDAGSHSRKHEGQ